MCTQINYEKCAHDGRELLRCCSRRDCESSAQCMFCTLLLGELIENAFYCMPHFIFISACKYHRWFCVCVCRLSAHMRRPLQLINCTAAASRRHRLLDIDSRNLRVRRSVEENNQKCSHTCSRTNRQHTSNRRIPPSVSARHGVTSQLSVRARTMFTPLWRSERNACASLL